MFTEIEHREFRGWKANDPTGPAVESDGRLAQGEIGCWFHA